MFGQCPLGQRPLEIGHWAIDKCKPSNFLLKKNNYLELVQCKEEGIKDL